MRPLEVSVNAGNSENRRLFLSSRDDRLSPIAIQTAIHGQYCGPSEMCVVGDVYDQHVLAAEDDLRYRQHVEGAYAGWSDSLQ